VNSGLKGGKDEYVFSEWIEPSTNPFDVRSIRQALTFVAPPSIPIISGGLFINNTTIIDYSSY